MKIETYPSDILKKGSHGPIRSLTPEYIADFIDFMRTSDGVGLASTQIGDEMPYIALETSSGPIFAIDPKIVEQSAELQTHSEGCLSIPGVYKKVQRSKRIIVEYSTACGERKKESYSNFDAVIWQHEIDHLNGILFTDRVAEDEKEKEILKLNA